MYDDYYDDYSGYYDREPEPPYGGELMWPPFNRPQGGQQPSRPSAESSQGGQTFRPPSLGPGFGPGFGPGPVQGPGFPGFGPGQGSGDDPGPGQGPGADFGPPFGGRQPQGPPPSFEPQQSQATGMQAFGGGFQFRPCAFRYNYIWMSNGQSFWTWLFFVGPRSIMGWRWRRGRWEIFNANLRDIRAFWCY